jgi:hypothetical protein
MLHAKFQGFSVVLHGEKYVPLTNFINDMVAKQLLV